LDDYNNTLHNKIALARGASRTPSPYPNSQNLPILLFPCALTSRARCRHALLIRRAAAPDKGEEKTARFAILRVAIYAFCKTPHLSLRDIFPRKGGSNALRLRFAIFYFYSTKISTLRFCCLPCWVALLDIGNREPKPMYFSFCLGIACFKSSL
jgi:hypothetical protein